MATTDFYTTVRNMSGRTRVFSFLPPHGKTLADGEEYSFPGRLSDYYTAPAKQWQYLKALEAISPTNLAIVKEPAVHCYDATKDVTKVLGVDNATVTAADPSWGAYSSSIG